MWLVHLLIVELIYTSTMLPPATLKVNSSKIMTAFWENFGELQIIVQKYYQQPER